jgi:hypothetical protein
VNLFDGIFFLVFLLISMAHLLGRLAPEYPHVFLYSDAANIAGFAAARDHPLRFSRDAILGDEENFRIYFTVHIPLLRALYRVTGEYGVAFISMLGLHVFLQAVGFYVLARTLIGSRYWAGLVALATLMTVQMNLGEFWGVDDHPVPRFTFQVFLPYLLAGALHWRSKPAAWPWLAAAAGLLFFVHPVSAPLWGLALWLGMWAFLPNGWPLGRKVRQMALVAGVFLAASAPFLVHYLANHAQGDTGVDAERVYEIMESRFAEGYLDIPEAVRGFVSTWGNRHIYGRWLFWAWAGAGALFILVVRAEKRKDLAVVGLWASGLLVCGVVIPLVEQSLLRPLGRVPVEVDLVRGLRYLIPLMLALCYWSLAELSKEARKRGVRGVPVAAGLFGACALAVWTHWHKPAPMVHALSCLRSGDLVCADANWQQARDVLEAVRGLTPEDATILPLGYALQIRYYALRPVVFCEKDGGILAYTNHARLLGWRSAQLEISSVLATPDEAARYGRLVELARDLGADFLLWRSDGPLPAVSVADIVWKGHGYVLSKVG